jgi:hypothetical protein
MSFKTFIKEESQKFGKLNHLEHVEDLAFHGEDGFNTALESLKEVHNRISGKPTKSKLTIKYDGSPSIVFGHDPKSDKFFVGTKAALSSKPTLNYTKQDITKNYSDRPDLAKKLSKALEHLPKVSPPKGIYQGDMMYTKDSVQEDNRHYNFTPNTIKYSVKKTDPEGQKIRRAEFGIVVHTKYHGKDMDDMHANFDPSIHNFKNNKDVHIIDPEINLDHKINNSEDTNNAFLKHINDAEHEINDADPDMFQDTIVHSQHLKRYINQTVKNDEKPTALGLKAFMTKVYNKDEEKLKTPAGKLKKKEQLLRHLNYIDDNHEKYQSLLSIHHHLRQAKNVLIDSLSKSNPYESSIDEEPVKGEGYVVTHNGHPSKLVHREEFTKKNFDRHKK